ncbi:MAG: hypothetical protein IIB14_05705 [Chloroflexi bacterium]|nr:hypothetical protein [Chloroflexota bacterium]
MEVLVDSFLATKPCEVITSMKREGENASISYVLRVHHQPPPTIRFAIGDVIHNLRATLDNLVWGVGQVFKANKRLGLEFYESESKFREGYLPNIRKLPDPIRDWITSIQPYQGRNHIVLFHRLHNLWNRDKHRTPTVINTAGVTGTLGYSGDQMPIKSMTFYRVSGQKDQQKIASAVIPWERRSEFKPEFSPLVTFNEDGPVGLNIVGNPESVVGYLRHIQEYIVARVVPKFEPYI